MAAKNSNEVQEKIISEDHIQLFLETKDIADKMPTHVAAIQCSLDKGGPLIDELDKIQSDLEILLSTAVLRQRMLNSKLESLSNDEKDDHGAVGVNEQANLSTTVKDRQKRKRSNNWSRRHQKSKQKPASKNNSKNSDKSKSSSPLRETTESYENLDEAWAVADDFWLSTDEYCKPVEHEDLNFLDKILEQYSEPLVPPIPELGPPCSNVFADTDREEEQLASDENSNSSTAVLKKGSTDEYCKPVEHEDSNFLDKILEQYSELELGPPCSNAFADTDREEEQQASGENSNSSTAVLKKDSTGAVPKQKSTGAMPKKRNPKRVKCLTGPLTQRLVSTLVEEQPEKAFGEIAAAIVTDDSDETARSSSVDLNASAISMELERNVRKQLRELNLLPEEDKDEIKEELNRVSEELSAVADFNRASLMRLQKNVKRELSRSTILRELKIVDKKIVAITKRRASNKALGIPLTTADKQEIINLTLEQKNLSEQLQQFDVKCSLYK